MEQRSQPLDLCRLVKMLFFPVTVHSFQIIITFRSNFLLGYQRLYFESKHCQKVLYAYWYQRGVGSVPMTVNTDRAQPTFSSTVVVGYIDQMNRDQRGR